MRFYEVHYEVRPDLRKAIVVVARNKKELLTTLKYQYEFDLDKVVSITDSKSEGMFRPYFYRWPDGDFVGYA